MWVLPEDPQGGQHCPQAAHSGRGRHKAGSAGQKLSVSRDVHTVHLSFLCAQTLQGLISNNHEAAGIRRVQIPHREVW